jgi:hypothetical protein
LFSVAFIGNVHYPANSEAVTILLQKKLAGLNGKVKQSLIFLIVSRAMRKGRRVKIMN